MWSSDRLRPKTPGHRLRGDDEPACQSVGVRLLTGLVLSGGLVACGFHPRGDVAYAFPTVYINASTAAPITLELRRALEGVGGTRIVGTGREAAVTLDIANVTDDKQVLSLSSGGRVREYLLTKRVGFSLHDAEGRDWLPAAEIVIRRSFTFNESEVLAREAEETRMLKEMQTDAVQQIVRRLQMARKPLA